MLHLRLILLLILAPILCFAENIDGDISDIHEKIALADVSITNIHTNTTTTSDANGKFTISVARGQLLEFRKIGYKTVRLRVPNGSIPSYFKILMEKGAIELPQFELQDHQRDWVKDSLRYYDIYKNAINYPQLTGLQMIEHPFSALSKHSREIWAFQKEYAYWQKEKYVDYTFNEDLVKRITGLEGDSVKSYLRAYRPSYEQLRSMNEYTFYSYIKTTVSLYRKGRIYHPSIRRSSN